MLNECKNSKLPYKFKMAAAMLSGLVSNKTAFWGLSWSHTHGVKNFLGRGLLESNLMLTLT